jgi:hypothetical protein
MCFNYLEITDDWELMKRTQKSLKIDYENLKTAHEDLKKEYDTYKQTVNTRISLLYKSKQRIQKRLDARDCKK